MVLLYSTGLIASLDTDSLTHIVTHPINQRKNVSDPFLKPSELPTCLVKAQLTEFCYENILQIFSVGYENVKLSSFLDV